MKIFIRIINFWPINKWFDLGVDPEPEDQSVFKDVEAQFWLVMRLWVLIMLVGFAFGFWLLFCKPETVDPKIKKAHEEHIEKVKKARREVRSKFMIRLIYHF